MDVNDFRELLGQAIKQARKIAVETSLEEQEEQLDLSMEAIAEMLKIAIIWLEDGNVRDELKNIIKDNREHISEAFKIYDHFEALYASVFGIRDVVKTQINRQKPMFRKVFSAGNLSTKVISKIHINKIEKNAERLEQISQEVQYRIKSQMEA